MENPLPKYELVPKSLSELLQRFREQQTYDFLLARL